MTPPRSRCDAAPREVGSGPTRSLLLAVDEVATLSPDLGWAEANGVAEGLLDQLAHRLADAAAGQPEPTPLPLVVGAIGGDDRSPDHAACRAAAARLRALAPLLEHRHTPWEREAATAMVALGDLLDQVADRDRSGRLGPTDKGVVLRRLHALQRSLRQGQAG